VIPVAPSCVCGAGLEVSLCCLLQDRVIQAETDNTNQRLERLYDALETGSLKLADLTPRIQRLRQSQEKLQAERWELESQLSDRKVELADLETVIDYVEDLRNLLEESPLTERKSFIKSFVKEVRVSGLRSCLPTTFRFQQALHLRRLS